MIHYIFERFAGEHLAMAPNSIAAAPPRGSLRQAIKQKLLKKKYPPPSEEEAMQLCSTTRSATADIVLDALTPVTSRGSSRAASAEPTASDHADAGTYHDITTSLLADDAAAAPAAAAGRSDQRPRGSSSRVKDTFKGCFPFQHSSSSSRSIKVVASTPEPNGGLPTAFNNRQSILSRLNRAAQKPAAAGVDAPSSSSPSERKAKTPTKGLAALKVGGRG